MNFFEQQARARRRTALLVVPFVLAVVAIVAALNVIGYIVFRQAAAGQGPAPSIPDWFEQPYWVWITLGTLAVIAAGSVKTSLQLRGGGAALAEMLGARRIAMDTTNADERRLINVVEEMSIASGTPMPRLYVLDEESSINAFVAGLRPTETVLVVTRGALEHFTRDELQGVVGHEYSHIFNGDMRLNMRLMGVLAGILLIGQIGRFLMRSGSRSRGKGSGQIVLLGLATFIIGYIGLFCGALIKAAISRQREFLADASAVQYTRNPDGIAGALYRILEHTQGSHLINRHADDVSHFCIGESVRAGFTSLLATHPPLPDRIRAIDPSYLIRRGTAQGTATSARAPGVSATAGAGVAGIAAAGAAVSAADVADSVGTVSARHYELAASLHAGLPAQIIEALHSPPGAVALCAALVLAGMESAARAAGIVLVRERIGEDEAGSAERLLPLVSAIGAGRRLPLLNLALPALKELSVMARARALAALEGLVHVDRRTTTFEFTLLTILHGHLAEDAGRAVPVKFYTFEAVLPEIRLLLSVLARAGGGDAAAVEATYRHGMAQFTREPGAMTPPAQCTLAALTAALGRLDQLAPLLQRPLVEACADCVIRDGRVLPAEAELLQAVAVALDCPMPPLPG